jgi:hypothetical protein
MKVCSGFWGGGGRGVEAKSCLGLSIRYPVFYFPLKNSRDVSFAQTQDIMLEGEESRGEKKKKPNLGTLDRTSHRENQAMVVCVLKSPEVWSDEFLALHTMYSALFVFSSLLLIGLYVDLSNEMFAEHDTSFLKEPDTL